MAKRTSNIALHTEYVDSTVKRRTSNVALMADYVDSIVKRRTSNVAIMVEYIEGEIIPESPVSRFGPRLQIVG